MESGNGESGPSHQEDEEIRIKQEQPQPAKQRSPQFTAGETIDLVSDNEDEDGMVGDISGDISLSVAASQHAEEPSVDIDNEENAAPATNHDEMLARQDQLAGQFRAQKNKSYHDEAAADFAKAKKEYQKLKKANKIDVEDEIEFMKLESAEMTRLRKKEADDEFDREETVSPPREDDDGEGLFVSSEPAIPRFSEMHSDDEGTARTKRKRSDDSDAEMPARKARARPKGQGAKKARNVPGTDYDENDFERTIERARKASAPKQAKTAAKGKAATKKALLPKSKGSKAKAAGPSMTNLDTLFGNYDVFGATAQTAGLAAQPTFSNTKRRPDALAQLIASVPTESEPVAKADKRYFDLAMKDYTGHASVGPAQHGMWFVKGMRTTLKAYQVLGTAFMRRRENDTHEPKGGILADEMGLGKTIMMLANIVNGRQKEKSKIKTTLIVASPALVTQWMEEIRRHAYGKGDNDKHGIGTVIQYRAGNRLNSNDPAGVLEGADIVLTTYHELSRSYPKAVVPPNLVTGLQKDAWWRDFYERERGVLHRVKFLRIVLDVSCFRPTSNHAALAR